MISVAHDRATAPAQPERPVPAAPEQRPHSRLAVASLVLGILGAVPLSAIFGILGLGRIKRLGQRGRGLAIAGLAISGLWVAVIAIAVVVGLLTGAERDGSGEVVQGGSMSVFDVRAGDCLNDLAESGATLSVSSVPCARPHDAQALTSFDIAREDWPGLDAVTTEADRGCTGRFEGAVPRAQRAGAEVFFFHPTEQSWETRDDRTVICIALFDRPRTGSVLRAG